MSEERKSTSPEWREVSWPALDERFRKTKVYKWGIHSPDQLRAWYVDQTPPKDADQAEADVRLLCQPDASERDWQSLVPIDEHELQHVLLRMESFEF